MNGSRRIAWPAPTLPLLAMAFHAPAFDPDGRGGRALDVLAQAYFAPTSALHKELVLDRQWVDIGVKNRKEAEKIERACEEQRQRELACLPAPTPPAPASPDALTKARILAGLRGTPAPPAHQDHRRNPARGIVP